MKKVLVMSLTIAMCFIAITLQSQPQQASNQTIDLRTSPNFNPWICWHRDFQAKYTWLEFRAKLAQLNGWANTDYAMRHIGVGSTKSRHGIVTLPALHDPSPITKIANKPTLENSETETERKLIASETKLAEVTLSLQNTREELNKVQAAYASAQAAQLKTAATLSITPTITPETLSLSQADQKIKTLSRSNTVLGWSLGGTGLLVVIMFWLLIKRSSESEQIIAAQAAAYKKLFQQLGAQEKELMETLGKMGNLERNNHLLSAEVTEARRLFDEADKTIKQQCAFFVVPKSLIMAHGGGEGSQSTDCHLHRDETTGLVYPPCHEVQVHLKNVLNHIVHCPKCWKELQRKGIFPPSSDRVVTKTPSDKQLTTVTS